MSLGRKKSSQPKKIDIKAPAPIQTIHTMLPTGSSLTSQKTGNTLGSQLQLDPVTQQTVNSSLSGMANLANSLAQDSPERENSIRQRAQNFFNQNRDTINEAADFSRQQLSSDLSKQFGGRFNTTFGNELLARQEGERLKQLSQARQESDLLAEDLVQQDETGRINRFNTFQNYLDTLNQLALGTQTAGNQALLSEQNRASSLAIQRSNLLQKYYQDQASQDQQRRSAALSTFLTLASRI
jgi:hypothetical protein